MQLYAIFVQIPLFVFDLFSFALKINGFPIEKAQRQLSDILAVPEENYTAFVEQKKREIVDFHLKNNKFYKNFIGEIDTFQWENIPVLKKSDFQIPLEKRLSIGYNKKTVYINSTSGSSGDPMVFAKDKWYAFILNASNTYRQLSLHVYALDANSNEGLPQLQNNDLIPAFHETKELNNAMMWNSDTYYHLNGAKLHITNIRMFEKPIELEQHHNVLNQYVVRDNQLALIIDNAIPSIGFQKFKNAR